MLTLNQLERMNEHLREVQEILKQISHKGTFIVDSTLIRNSCNIEITEYAINEMCRATKRATDRNKKKDQKTLGLDA